MSNIENVMPRSALAYVAEVTSATLVYRAKAHIRRTDMSDKKPPVPEEVIGDYNHRLLAHQIDVLHEENQALKRRNKELEEEVAELLRQLAASKEEG